MLDFYIAVIGTSFLTQTREMTFNVVYFYLAKIEVLVKKVSSVGKCDKLVSIP